MIDIIDEALAIAGREHKPISKEQRARLRYWDFYLHDLETRIERQRQMKELHGNGR